MAKQSTNGQKRAGLYARVSSSGQRDNSSSADQFERGRAYCDVRGYKIVTELPEVISGSFYLARSKYNELLGMAADGQLDVIVVDIPDRLGRGDVIGKLEMMAELNGATVEYASPGRDTSTVEGLVQKSAEEMVSGIERMNIRRRTMNGRRVWARNGRVIATRFRPYGYDVVSEYDERGRKTSCRLVIRQDEAAVILRIFELCVYGGLTTNAIVKKLSDEKVPTPSESISGKTRKMKGIWSHSTVGGILTNETYKGIWHYAKKNSVRLDTPEGVKVKRLEKQRADAIPVPVPAIVPVELWEAAQEQLKENRRKFKKPTKLLYLLRSRIRCALCGRVYIGGSQKFARARGYYCGRNRAEFRDHRCKSGPLNAADVEAAVWNAVVDAIQDEERLLAGLEKGQAEAERGRRIIENAIAAVQSQIDTAQGKLDRYLDLYGSGDLSKEKYLDKEREVAAEVRKHQEEKARLAERLAEYVVISQEQISDLRHFRAEIQDRLSPDVPFEDKVTLLDLLRVECFYDDRTGELVVNGLFGKVTLTVKSRYSGQYNPLRFSIVLKKVNGHFERAAVDATLSAFFAKTPRVPYPVAAEVTA